MEDNRFDKTLREKLEQHDPAYDPSSWDALSERMAVSEDLSFDESIKEKIQDVDVPYEASSWTVLESKIQDASDAELDEVVREKITVDAGGYDRSSWSVLLRRLESWEEVRRKFWVLRSAEALMLLLLLLALYQYRPGVNQNKLQDMTLAITETQGESEFDKTDGLIEGMDVVGDDVSDARNQPASADAEGIEKNVDLIKKSAGEIGGESIDPGADDANSNKDTDLEGRPINTANKAFAVNENFLESKEGSITGARNDDVYKTEIEMTSPDQSSSITEITAPLSMMLSPVSLNAQEQLEWAAQSLDIPAITADGRQIWLSLQSHGAVNRVHTPAEDEFEARKAYTMGYGMGLLVGFTHDRLVWETGVEYQLTIFKPQRTKYTGNISDGYRKTTLSEVNLDYINIPLQARYVVHASDRHEFYALGGIKLHISSKVDFDFVEERTVDPTKPIDFSKPAADIIGVNEGRFTYFSLNAGLGYQYILNTRTKLFAQPSYEHFAERHGIMNLNGEKVNSYRLDFGVRVKL